MEIVFEFLLLLVTFLLELGAGHWGFYLPLAAALFFYLGASRSFGGAMVLALLYGALTDLVYDRPVPLTAAVLAGTLALLHLLRADSRRMESGALILSGALGGAVNALGMEFLALLLGAESRAWDYRVAQLIFGALAGALLYPAFAMLLDALAGHLELARLRSATPQNDAGEYPRRRVLRRHLALKDGR